MNGRLATSVCGSYDDAESQKDSNFWSASENNTTNAYNINFQSGSVNNNNKYNSYVARAVTAFQDYPVPQVFLDSVWEAYHACMRGKFRSKQAIEYMSRANDDIPVLAKELWSKTYKPGTSTCFMVLYPKPREVFAASFRDRIVHHWICMRLEPLFEERFVEQGNVSFNCRKGFGTDKCVAHCAEGMKRVSEHYRKKAWLFKGDIVGFFMSIDKTVLWYFMDRFLHRWRKRMERECSMVSMEVFVRLGMQRMPEMYWDVLIYATRIVILHRPEEDCVLNSPVSLWERLSPNKSLFGCDKVKGEPIGNLTTQLFANFLMSYFDEYVLFLFRHHSFSYERFVDDFVVTCDDLQILKAAIPKMEGFLKTWLRLEMHKERYLQPVSHGVLFVGTYIKPGRMYLSNRTLARFRERAVGYRRLMEVKKELTYWDCKRIEQVMNSYFGFCQRKRTYRFRKSIINMMGDVFWKYFYVEGHYESIHMKNEYKLNF
jgi:hypothetical protein